MTTTTAITQSVKLTGQMRLLLIDEVIEFLWITHDEIPHSL